MHSLIMVGNLSNYTSFDIIRVFLALSGEKKSRYALSSHLDMGEGSLRTILTHLKKKKIIHSSPSGHCLTSNGNSILRSINTAMNLKNSIPIQFYKHLGFKNTAILLFSRKKIAFSIIQRDIAIKNGAESCLVFIVRKGKLQLPLIKGSFAIRK